MFVHAKDVYPRLLLARLFFALGGAATATMVTAILPSMTRDPPRTEEGVASGDMQPPSYVEVTQDPLEPLLQQPESEVRTATSGSPDDGSKKSKRPQDSSMRLAGLVGTFAGAGALIALVCFLPLPAQFSKLHVSSAQALRDTFYVVGSIALAVAVFCLIGLRGLQGEEHKSWRQLWRSAGKTRKVGRRTDTVIAYRKLFFASVQLGVKDPSVGLAYLGGWVARASSVGITLFIPLAVNHYFHSAGLCNTEDPVEVKRQCQEAYLLAAKLTGISQAAALVCAPVFGFVDHRFPRYQIGLLVSTISGIVGYIGFAAIKTPDPSRSGGTGLIYPVIILIGISQIGAIVCSLGLLGRAIADPSATDGPRQRSGENRDVALDGDDSSQARETAGLLATGAPETADRHRLQGSMAGVYSLCGGAGILVLTKVGGLLFDRTSPGSPFYMMAIFNAVLLVGTVTTTAFRLLPSASRGNAGEEAM